MNNFSPDNVQNSLVQYYNEASSLEHQRCWNAVYLESVKTINRMMCNEQKAALEEKRDMRRHELQMELMEKKELSLKTLLVDSFGYLCIVLINQKGEQKISQPITHVRDFQSFILSSGNMEKSKGLKPVLKVSWFGDEVGVLLPLDGDNASACKLLKKLQERGVSFRFPRRDSTALREYFFGWLIDNAEKVKIPERLGWNELEDGAWYFEKNPCKTLEGVNANE